MQSTRGQAISCVRLLGRHALYAAVVWLISTAAASAQSALHSANSDRVGLASTFDAQTLAELPTGENVYSVLETTQAELISDRFNSSGLNVGEPARVGGFLASWSQTLFRIGEIDITDPAGSGAPLMFPEILPWQQVHIANGTIGSEVNTPGLAVTLAPRRASTMWTRSVYVLGSGGSLASRTPNDPVPPVARLDDWSIGAATVSGPVADRLGLVAGGTWSRASKFMRETNPTVTSTLASGFAHLVYTVSPASEWRTFGWVQSARSPLEYQQLFQPPDAGAEDTSVHVQSTWERGGTTTRRNWRVLGSFTQRSRTNDLGTALQLTADRLTDGPIPTIVSASGDTTAGRWTIGGRLAPLSNATSSRHALEIGVDLDRAFLRTSDQFSGTIGELVDGSPARAWSFTRPSLNSRRHVTTVTGFATDHVTFSPALVLDVGLRFESMTGSAEGAANGVSWHTLLPQAAIRWEFAEGARLALVGGYRRSANRLNLDWLAFGDPAAPVGRVSRWLGGQIPPSSPIIDRVGPGTGGDPTFSRIDEDLDRPYTDEFVIGLESIRRGWLRLGLTGIARREANTLAVVDMGVPLSSYSTIGIPDPGLLFFESHDDQILPAYNRLPSSFGRNQYLLTNPDGQSAATAYALKLTVEGSTNRLFLLFAATASIAEGSAGNRGYDPFENDQDTIGELYTNPNATTYAEEGRLFADRAFTIKWTTVYRFPGDIHLGAIARYQDGQPFARLVIAQDLNQGAEAIRAYPNGKNRFTFTGSLDLRVQKPFTVGTTRLDAMLDVYNLLTRGNEVEEYVVTGDAFRTPTAIQPPASVHLGVRLTF